MESCTCEPMRRVSVQTGLALHTEPWPSPARPTPPRGAEIINVLPGAKVQFIPGSVRFQFFSQHVSKRDDKATLQLYRTRRQQCRVRVAANVSVCKAAPSPDQVALLKAMGR